MAVDPVAAAAGLRPGQLLAAARALRPDLVCAERDAAAEASALQALARACARFSPNVAAPPDAAPGEDALFLDVYGLAHLFGGEAALLRALRAFLAKRGISARLAIADTPGAAWALARFSPTAAADAAESAIAPPGAGLAPLLALEVSALRLPENTVAALRAVGLKRIGQLRAQSRASLLRRFGPALLDRLDAAAGALPDPLNPLPPPPRFFAHARFAEPLLSLESLTAAAAELAATLVEALAKANHGARRLRLILWRVDAAQAQIEAGLARPAGCAKILARALARRLETLSEGLDIAFGVDAMGLIALSSEPLRAQTISLDPGAAEAGLAAAALADLQERLAAKLGEDALIRLAPHDSHWPERAQRALKGLNPTKSASSPTRFRPLPRPVFLQPSPEPIEAIAEVPDGPPLRFRWRRLSHAVAWARGPERIAPEWWREGAGEAGRDYFLVQTREGRRFWLFREGGYGDGEAPPRWFAHGSFV